MQLDGTASGTDGDLCKYHAIFMHCYREAYLAYRSEINDVSAYKMIKSDIQIIL